MFACRFQIDNMDDNNNNTKVKIVKRTWSLLTFLYEAIAIYGNLFSYNDIKKVKEWNLNSEVPITCNNCLYYFEKIMTDIKPVLISNNVKTATSWYIEHGQNIGFRIEYKTINGVTHRYQKIEI